MNYFIMIIIISLMMSLIIMSLTICYEMSFYQSSISLIMIDYYYFTLVLISIPLFPFTGFPKGILGFETPKPQETLHFLRIY